MTPDFPTVAPTPWTAMTDARYILKTPGMATADLHAAIASRPSWFHHFDFENGLSTPGPDPSAFKLHALDLPDRLDGLSVIDIGSYDGYFAFQAEARGARSVVASDEIAWHGPGFCALENFRLVKTALASRVEEQHVDVGDIDPARHGTYDLVLFLGVLYHAPDMVAYLRRVRSVTKGMAVIETLVDMLDVDEPCAAYYPPGALNASDTSNWWGPNPACVTDMLTRVGFSRIAFIGIYHFNQRALLAGLPTTKLKSARAVWHAYV